MIRNKSKLFIGFLICLQFCFCREEKLNDDDKQSKQELKQTLVNANKIFVEQENKRINSYIERHKFKMSQTGTGLRYEFLNEGEGDHPVEGDRVEIAYTSKVIDGELIVGNEGSDTIQFIIGKSETVAGLNEGVKLLRPKQRARFIMPTHLAYGLTGDNINVPSNAALLYQVQLLKIEKIKYQENE